MRYLFAACLLASVFGCETFEVYDGPTDPPRLVVSAAFQPDSVWTVTVNRSRPLTEAVQDGDDYGPPVRDAAVTITPEGAAPIELVYSPLNQNPGRYRAASRRPVPGVRYRLDVRHNDLGHAWAEVVAPGAPSASFGPLRRTQRDENLGVAYYRGTLEVHAPPLAASFFRLSAAQNLRRLRIRDHTQRPFEFDTVAARTPVRFRALDSAWRSQPSDDGVLPIGGGTNVTVSPRPTGEYPWSFTVEIAAQDDAVDDSAFVSLSALSSELMEAVTTIDRQNQLEGAPLSGPIRITGNLNGGLGYFGGLTTITFAVELD